jgi:hypothetical protein
MMETSGSNTDPLSLFCCVLGDATAFKVTFDKAWEVDLILAKDAIDKRLQLTVLTS